MQPGDRALERIIAELTTAIAMTGDPRLVQLRNTAMAMRTEPSEIERMQRERERAVRWRRGTR